MTFPASPTDGDQHTEGVQTYTYDATNNAWLQAGLGDDTPKRSAVLPATDGTEGFAHALEGHGTLPDGHYTLIGTTWVQS